MPISRKYFQPELQHHEDGDIGEQNDKWKLIDSRERPDRGNLVVFGAGKTPSTSFDEDLAKNEFEATYSLPPAVAPSAEIRDANGQDQPKTKAHRSVATGGDAPFALDDTEADRRTAGKDIGPERGGNEDEEARTPDGSDAVGSELDLIDVKTSAAWERAIRLRNGEADHLNRIHELLGGLMELMEAHSNDHEDQMRTLEQRLAQLEMRIATNRMSQ